MRIGIPLASAIGLLFYAGAPAMAQTIHGTVRDANSDAPLPGATVAMLDSSNAVIGRQDSDARGHYQFVVRRSGILFLRASLVGYEDTHTPPFRVHQDTVIIIALIASAVPIDPLEVRATGRALRLVETGFYTRQAKGFGSYLTREQIDTASPALLTDLLRSIPGVRVVRVGLGGSSFDVLMPGAGTMFFNNSKTPCYPSILIDGVVVRRGGQNDEAGGWVHLVPPSEVEGVEVYTSAAGLPVQVAGQTSPCGSILIWTRR